MEKNYKELKERIYDLMNGVYDLTRCKLIEECEFVEDEYADGKPCERLYSDMLDAFHRVSARLGVQEDSDAEAMRNCWEQIGRHMCMKMFDYGVYCAQNGILERKIKPVLPLHPEEQE